MRRNWVICAAALLARSLSRVSGQELKLDPQTTSLLLLRGAIDGNGALTTWTPTGDVCTSWEGITCDASGKVTAIDLQGKGLEGQIPLDEGLWGNLDALQNFNVAENELSGFLPPQMSVLSNLEYLSVGSNQLESVLPGSWEALAKVKGIDASGNMLYGDLPPQWGSLSSLEALDLSGNNLSGTIPASWSGLGSLQAASLAGNAQLCADNPDAGTDAGVPVYYGPCDATSPQLPDINPDYPPAPQPSPAPVPSPAPQPTPTPEPSPAPLPVPAPPPVISRPSDYVELKMTVTGGDGAFYNSAEYRAVVAKAAKVLPAWVEVTGTSAVTADVTVPPKTGTRKLLAEVPATEISNKVYSDNQDTTVDNLNAAIDDGSLSRDLESELGVILVPGTASASKPSSTNVGAIVGGVIGGVCALIIIVVIVWLVVVKKRGDSAPIGEAKTGQKSGDVMYVANPLSEDAGEGVTASKKEEFTTFDGAAYDMNEPTPRSGRSKQAARTADAIAKGVNPLSIPGLERNDSGLSDPDSARYQSPSVASSAPMTARSRLESARSGLDSNPLGKLTPREIFDGSSDEDEGNNPLYAKSTARSGASTYNSARTGGLDIDSSRKYESATESVMHTARTHASMTSNPLGGVDEDADDAAQGSARSSGSTNPLFRMLQGKK